MPFNTPVTSTRNYTFGRGIAYLAILDDNLRPMGERDVGNCPGLNISITTEKVDHFSSRAGIKVKDKTVVLSVDFAGQLTTDDTNSDNLAAFIAGVVGTVTQVATPVTNERIYNAQPEREYQLGATVSNPSGVRTVSSVTVGLYELVNAVARVNSTAYVVGDIFKSSTNVFVVTTAGTTAGSAPAFTTTAVGDATTDGTAVVKFLGTTSNFTVTTHYQLSSLSARVAILNTGILAEACDLYTTVTGNYLSLNVGYTPAANTREQITSSGNGELSCQFRFIADNAEGTNRDLFIASCTLAPSGEVSFITESDFASMVFDIGVNSRDSSTPQIIIDGRPA